MTRDLTNAANKIALAESGFGAFSQKAEHMSAILGQGQFQIGEETRDYFGMTIDQRATAIADLEFATIGKHLPDTDKLKFRTQAKDDAAGLIAAYDIASSLSRMEAGNPDMFGAERITEDTPIDQNTGMPEGSNVQAASLDAAISFYSGMKGADGNVLTGDALRAKISSHLGGNLASFLSADYAEEFPDVPREQIATIAAEDAYSISASFADAVLENQSTPRRGVSGISRAAQSNQDRDQEEQ